MKHRRCSIIFPMILLAALAGAQITPAEQEKKYRPNDSSPFSRSTENKKGAGSSEFANAISFIPTALLRQKALFQYERRLVEGLSLVVLIGKAFGSDYLQNMGFQILDLDINGDFLSASQIATDAEYYGSSPLLSGGLKVYYSGEVFDGGYIGFDARSETLRYKLAPELYGIPVYGNRTVDFKMWSVNLGFGTTIKSGKNDKLVHNLNLTMGIKNFTYNSFELAETIGSFGTYENIYQRSNRTRTTRIVPAVNISYSFGLGF